MKKMIAVSVVALTLGACAQAPHPLAAGPAADRAAPALDVATLTAYEWRLVEASDPQGQPVDALRVGLEQPVRLAFSETGVNLQGGCNTQFGGYALESGALQIGHLAATMKACAPALMQLDAGMAARLHGRVAAQVRGAAPAPRLILAASGGDTLVFAGTPTPETRYGGPGDIMFLEIAPERVACSHPFRPEHRCLLVRERRYDAGGILQPSAADWQPLYQDIEGYTHPEGEHAILRVKRFTDPHPPADGSSRVYILDLVVQRG